MPAMTIHKREKFVQTFFLAKQPNGYFVPNNVFRFLKEDTAESKDRGKEDVSLPCSQTLEVAECPELLTVVRSFCCLPSPSKGWC